MSAPAVDVRPRVVAAMFDTVADAGLDRLTVREVAGRAGVSIGAVQHHFRTKDDMLTAAFTELVTRTRTRLERQRRGADIRANLVAALSQLLPLDAERAAETRVHLAFAAHAAVTPGLAAIQAETLAAVIGELTVAIDALALGDVPAARRAQLLLAGTDGLALHAVSAARAPSRRSLLASLTALVDALLPTGSTPRSGDQASGLPGL